MNALDLDHVPSQRKRHRKESQRLLESRELSHLPSNSNRPLDAVRRKREREREEGGWEKEDGGRGRRKRLEKKRRRKDPSDDIESIEMSIDCLDEGIREEAEGIDTLLEAISRLIRSSKNFDFHSYFRFDYMFFRQITTVQKT